MTNSIQETQLPTNLMEVENETPETVYIPCPNLKFENTYVKKNCFKCEFYKGIGIMAHGNDLPWHKKFSIRCAYPMTRRTHNIEII